MKKSSYIPILNHITTVCRLLPNYLQALIFIFLYIGFQFLILTDFIFYVIIGLEVIFIILLSQKFIIYKKISNLKTAIELQILWIKSKKDAYKIKIYFIIFILMTIGLIYIFKSMPFDWISFISSTLLVILFSLKAFYYVPETYIKINERWNLEFHNIFQGFVYTFNIKEIQLISLYNGMIIIETNKETLKQKIEFYNHKEKERLYKFISALELNVINNRSRFVEIGN